MQQIDLEKLEDLSPFERMHARTTHGEKRERHADPKRYRRQLRRAHWEAA